MGQLQRVLLLASALAFAVHAQDPAALAWTAHAAAQKGDRGAIPSLIPLLRHQDPGVQLAVADALIQLGAEPAAENLQGVRIDSDLAPILVLASRNPKKYEALLLASLDQTLSDEEWTAIHSILLQNPPAGFAARILREWRLRITVDVEDSHALGERPFSGTYRTPPRPKPERAGFPPLMRYVIFEGGAEPGGTRIAGGPHPVSYVRLSTARNAPTHSRDDYRRDYLAALAGYGVPHSYATFRWTTPGKYRSDAAELLALVQRANRELREILTQRNLLSPSESSASPPPEIRVRDLRTNHQQQLPDVGWPKAVDKPDLSR